MNSDITSGELAYKAYQRHHEQWNGTGMDDWEELDDVEREAWESAARAVIDNVIGPSHER